MITLPAAVPEFAAATVAESGLSIIRHELEVVGAVTRSTGEEAGRRDPDRPVGYRIGTGDRVRDLWASDRYGITVLCRAAKAHRLCTIYRHAGSPDTVEYRTRAGLVLGAEAALWLAPHRDPLRVTRWGVPPQSLVLEHVCGGRMVSTAVALGRVRMVLAEMEASGCVEIRSVTW